MSIQFRKRITIIPGLLWINLGKGGISTSVGTDGITLNYGRTGLRTTYSLRGTGLKYVSLRKPTPLPNINAATGGWKRAASVICALLWCFLLGWLAANMR